MMVMSNIRISGDMLLKHKNASRTITGGTFP